jgi:hypothetical protein
VEEEVTAARGDTQKEAACCVLTGLQADKRALVVKRGQATQRLLVAFEPAEVTRLYASSEFRHAVHDLSDPDAVVNAVLAIHQARCGGSDSILDTAAALITEDKAADYGVGTYQYFEKLYSCLRNISLLLNPDSFSNPSPG